MLRKLAFVVAGILGLMTAVSPAAFAAAYSGGSGTEATPYCIATPQDLVALSDTANAADWDKHFLMTNDIDMSGVTGFTPIAPDMDAATDGFQGTPFTGVFDGGNHTIQYVNIILPEQDGVGLFGKLISGDIHALNIKNFLVSGRNGVGGLLGASGIRRDSEGHIIWSSISNVIVNNAKIEGYDGVGGLAGNLDNTPIIHCTSTATVHGQNSVGGIVGSVRGEYFNSEKVAFAFCNANVEVTGNSSIGGLIGFCNIWDEKITYCFSAGHVVGSGDGNETGGLIGFVAPPLLGMENCYSTATVNGGNLVGGMFGWCDTSYPIKKCFSSGDVYGYDNVGGLSGRGGEYTDCYSTGDVTGNDYVGGLSGQDNHSTHCYSTSIISGKNFVGGLVGSNSTVTSSFWDTTTGGPDNGIGTGLPTAQMKQRSTFESAGWDFSGTPPTWIIFDGLSYPHLCSFPMPIESISALQALSQVNNGSFFLTQDLDARETAQWNAKSGAAGFIPIGTLLQPFNGTLDGHGHRINGLYINRPSLDGVGLFGCLGPDSLIKGIGLDNVSITGGGHTGGLAGVNQGTVEQCYVRGNVTGANAVGGLLGSNLGSVRESYAAATVSGISLLGGLIGENTGGTDSGSFWDVPVSRMSYSAGGSGLATKALYQAFTYTNAGWDFRNTWGIAEGMSYPYFQNSLLLRVLIPPASLINADAVEIEVETFVPGLFVTVGGGGYPAYRFYPETGQGVISVPLSQEAINTLVVSAVSAMGVETIAARYTVYESNQFTSIPTAVASLTLAPPSASLAAGDTQQYACMVRFTDGTTGDATPVTSWNAQGGTITSGGLYTHVAGLGTVQALLHAESGWHSSIVATVTTSKKGVGAKAGTGRVSGVVRSHYTGLGLPAACVTAYNLFNPGVETQQPVSDTLGNYIFLLNTGKYHFEGACSGHRSEIARGGLLLEPRDLLTPGPPPHWSEPYYSGQIKTDRPLNQDFWLRPNDTGAPWVVFIEPVADTTVRTSSIVVTAIDADQYSALSVANYTHNAQEYAIPDKISSTGFYRDTWPLELGLNVLHLFTMDTEGNASEKTIQITYDPDYNTPGGDDDHDGMPNAWETEHGLDPHSTTGVNGAEGDLDGDGLRNLEEYQRGTMPNATRSDADTLTDSIEVGLGTNPLAADTDGDGVNDDVEWAQGSNPLRDDRIKMQVVNLPDGTLVRGNAVTLLADVLDGYALYDVVTANFAVRGEGTARAWRAVGTVHSAPFTTVWDTTTLPAGTYQVRAVATSRLGCVDGTPPAITVTVSPEAPWFERIESGVHILTAPVQAAPETLLALCAGTRFARITIPAGALAADDIVTAFFPEAADFAPDLHTMQRDAGLYLNVQLSTHTGNFLGGKCAKLEMGYPDADRDDHLDVSGLRVSMLSVNYLPAPDALFEALDAPGLDRRLRCVTDETRHFSVFGVIEEQPAAPVNLLNSALPQGTAGVAYNALLEADGGLPPYTWTIVDGVLPSGLGIAGNTIEGMPGTAGTFTFTLQVTDAQLPPATVARSFTLGIYAANQPSVTILRKGAQPGIAKALPAQWDITFNETVSGFANEDVVLTGTAAFGATYAVTGSGNAYVLEVSNIMRDGTLHPSVAAGNAASITTGALNRPSADEEEIWIDRRKPQAQFVSANAGLLDYGTIGPVELHSLPAAFTLTFDEPVTELDPADISFADNPAGLTFEVLGEGKDYTVLVTEVTGPVTLTPAVMEGGALDSAGNGSVAVTYAGREVHYAPETRATVTLEQDALQPDPVNAFPIVFRITFSEVVTGFDAGGVTFAGTAGDPVYTVTGSGAEYTLTVTETAGDGRIAFIIPEDVTDGGNAASISLDNEVTYDSTAPAISIGLPSTTLTRQGPVSYVLHYTGADVITLDEADITLEGSPTADVSVTPGVNPQTRITTLSNIAGLGNLTIRIAPGTAQDNAGNMALATGPSQTVSVDPRLNVTVNQAAVQRDPDNHLPLVFDVRFVEDVTGFDETCITMDGTASGVVWTLEGSGANYTLLVTSATNPGAFIPSIAAGVCQGVWGGVNEASISTDNIVTYDPRFAFAEFSAATLAGKAPLAVAFFDESDTGTLSLDIWEWDFGDGATSAEQDPEHVYETPGIYTVSLTVTTAANSDTLSRPNYIHVTMPVPVSGTVGLILLTITLLFVGIQGVLRHYWVR